ncbi:MAG: alternative ribosome rescue aminoacyl-tRNA hydrolase ArfB [Patescibacteria group bacterium]
MLHIPESELNFDFVRASGPGGQNVNKTSTKVQLRWHVDNSVVLNEMQKLIVSERLRSKLTNTGELIIQCSETRSQIQNKLRAKEILNQLVNDALTPTTPRYKTKAPYSSTLNRLAHKKLRGQIKKSRKPLSPNFD